ncbi:DEKNAAC103002 [Brettanomyces naardenensis]|uniref:DEKNAAC103002 n=1 Tax=Brettanomyces naardenensis TaxID=13370 RepID=A0A448YM56_BRENA|nr:DEKNAAC103002 [Brettanomyces naardenensis]
MDTDDVNMLPPHLQYQQPEGTEQTELPEQSELPEQGTLPEQSTLPEQTEPPEQDPTEPRPNALYLRGVESLDTRAIKGYVDSYIKPDYTFAEREKYAKFNYKLEWVNDDSINIVFLAGEDAPEGAQTALRLLTDESADIETLEPTAERTARPYLKEATNEEATATIAPQPEHIDLTIRQSFYGDRKVKNARIYSRYYLLHGEPDRTERAPAARDRMRGKSFGYHDYSRDLITGEEHEPELISGGGERTSYRDVYEPSNDRWDHDRYRDTYRPEGGRSRRRGRRGANKYRSSRDDDGRRRKADEDDLFPDFFKRKEDNRDREESPSRT